MVRKTKEEAAATRHSLLRAALQVFSQRGYSAATLQNIADRAGVTRGAIYWHFAGKAELYAALVEQVSSRGAEIAQAAIAEGGSYGDVLRRALVRLLTAVEEDKDLRAAMELSMFKTEMTPDLKRVMRRQEDAGRALIEGLAAALEQGIRSGQLRSDVSALDMARAFMALQSGAVYLWLTDPRAFSLRESAGAFADVYLRGILHGR